MKYFLLLILTFQFFVINAQVKVGFDATGKHDKAINTYKEIREQSKQRKEQLKLIKDHQAARNFYKEEYSKLKNERLGNAEVDSLKPIIWSKEDSIFISNQILSNTNFPESYQKMVLNPISLDSLMLASADSVAYNPEFLIAEHLKEYLPYELRQQENLFVDGDASSLLGNEIPNLKALKKPSKPNPNLVKPDEANDLLKKLDTEQFNKIQSNLSKLKKKYTEIPDIRFPEEGRKRNSLEDLPFKKRLFFGGNFGIKSTDPPIIDANIQVGYQINKKWMGGIGLIIREQFDDQNAVAVTGDSYGYSFFSKYDILKQFYIWSEIDRQLNRSLFENVSENESRWQESYLLGIGKEFKLGPLQMMSMLLYDFNHRNNDLNTRAFVFKIGVRLSSKIQ